MCVCRILIKITYLLKYYLLGYKAVAAVVYSTKWWTGKQGQAINPCLAVTMSTVETVVKLHWFCRHNFIAFVPCRPTEIAVDSASCKYTWWFFLV